MTPAAPATLASFVAAVWPTLLPLLVTAALGLLGLLAQRLAAYVEARTAHDNTWRVLQVLSLVAIDTVTKAQSQILPLIGKATNSAIARQLLALALQEVQAAGSDVIQVAGWSSSDLATQLLNLLETGVATLAAKNGLAPAPPSPSLQTAQVILAGQPVPPKPAQA